MPNPLTLNMLAEAMCNAAWAEVNEDWSLASDEQREEFRLMARALLTTIEKAGYKVVPVEPTSEMIEAGTAAIQSSGFVDSATALGWSAMLASAPNIGDE